MSGVTAECAGATQLAVFWNKVGPITEIPTSAISGRSYMACNINDLGWVAAGYDLYMGQGRGFIMTP